MLAGPAFLESPGGAVGGGGEPSVAAASVAAACCQVTLLRLGQVGLVGFVAILVQYGYHGSLRQ